MAASNGALMSNNTRCVSFLLASCVISGAFPAGAQTCSNPRNTQFYEDHHYTVRAVTITSPFSFFFLVKQRFRAIVDGLPLKAGDPFSRALYDAQGSTVEEEVRKDSALGKDTPAKVVVSTGGIESCVETGDHLTVDIVYHVFSTDPLPAAVASPDMRQAAIGQQATAPAESTSQPDYKIIPKLSYDHTRRGFGGVYFARRMPGGVDNFVDLSAQGSSSSKALNGQVHWAANVGKEFLDKAEFNLAYSYTDMSTLSARLTKGIALGHFQAVSKPIDTEPARFLIRYGAGLDQGNQQSGSTSIPLPPDTIGNSAIGSVRFYGGLTAVSNHFEGAASYGLQIGGPGLTELGFAKHIGDVSFSARVPGGSHSPFDFTVRATAGGITRGSGNNRIPINDRFFGGNTVSAFIPGDNWTIPNGPLVRSIATNRFAGGGGFGGTSFYSLNATVGKVLWASPIIPRDVDTPDFGERIGAAEASAQNWFADDFEGASPFFAALIRDVPPKMKSDVDAASAEFKAIRAASPGGVSATLNSALNAAEHTATRAQQAVGHAADPAARGPDSMSRLRQWIGPASQFRALAKQVRAIKSLVDASAGATLEGIAASIDTHLKDLQDAFKSIDEGPERAAAKEKARLFMLRPRAVVDALRFEANRYAVSLVGLADIGRLWPDPLGTRYAYGFGGRFSLVTVNFTLGYAINPNPHRELGQGRGAAFFSITYTNLFR